MSLDIIVPLLITAIVSILGSSGVNAFITSRANRQLIAAQAAQTDAGTNTTVIENFRMMLGEYRTQAVENKVRTDELEQRIADLEKRNRELELELGTQDTQIEKLNGLYLKMESGYRLNELQILSWGYEPLIRLANLSKYETDNILLMLEGARNIEDRTIWVNRAKRQADEAARTEVGPTDSGSDE